MGPIKSIYNSKFDFTTESLATNTVVIARVLRVEGALSRGSSKLSVCVCDIKFSGALPSATLLRLFFP